MAKRFDRVLEKATDNTLVEPNWDGILECVDMIRGAEVPVKNALQSIKKRIHNENPHVSHHALLVLEACVKNCGTKFHFEVATKDFMEDIKNMAFDSTPENVKTKILELMQCWSIAFKDKPEYKIIIDTHNLMMLAGFEFPKIAEADAMFVAENAPDWAEGEECFRCRTAFGLITRKHHCRACGQVFCDKCSSKQSFLPQYGIEKPVRICDGCFEKTQTSKKQSISSQPESVDSSSKSSKTATDAHPEQKLDDLKQAEEDELNLALAISQSEAEAQEQERQRKLYQLYNGPDVATSDSFASLESEKNFTNATDQPAARETSADAASLQTLDMDPELSKYLNREYWQQRKNEQKRAADSALNIVRHKSPQPTAPPPSESSHSRATGDADRGVGPINVDSDWQTNQSIASTIRFSDTEGTSNHAFASAEQEETAETMEFCRQLSEQVTIMENRVRSNMARGRPVVNDSAIQSLFTRLTEMHAQVMARMNKLDDQRTHYETLQDHVAHIQEARQAVNALREDYERRQQERAIEEQKARQQQMQQKLYLMRQKKQESLLHQRNMAVLRFQQREQEVQMRRLPQQQQSQGTAVSSVQPILYQILPGVGVPQFHPTEAQYSYESIPMRPNEQLYAQSQYTQANAQDQDCNPLYSTIVQAAPGVTEGVTLPLIPPSSSMFINQNQQGMIQRAVPIQMTVGALTQQILPEATRLSAGDKTLGGGSPLKYDGVMMSSANNIATPGKLYVNGTENSMAGQPYQIPIIANSANSAASNPTSDQNDSPLISFD